MHPDLIFETPSVAPMPSNSAPDLVIIFNPHARGEKAGRFEDEIRGFAPAETMFLATLEAGHATVLAREMARGGAGVVIAAGGDGTVNEVVNGLMQAHALDGVAAEDLPALGVLPAGTINVFAQELGLPLNLPKAWELIQRGHTQALDVGRANDMYFMQMAGVGLDAQVVRDTDPDRRRTLGPLSYVFTAASVLGKDPPRLVVEVPGQKPVEGAFVLVGNGRYYAGPFELFKGAKMNDGLLEILIFQHLSYQDVLRYLPHIALGQHQELEDVRTLSVAECLVRREGEAPGTPTTESVPTELDGEVTGHTPVRFSVLPRALRVCVPGGK